MIALNAETDLNAEARTCGRAYRLVELRDRIVDEFGMNAKTVYYHTGRSLGAPEIQVGRQRWYSERQLQEARVFFAGLARRKKADSAGA